MEIQTPQTTKTKPKSEPRLCGFNPRAIPYQWRVIDFLRREFNHAEGTPEILLSGSVGSAKSILLAHVAVTHCLFNRGARVALCRRAMPDLKRTIFKEILEHIETDLVEGRDYVVNQTSASIAFSNGSEIISISWADKRYKKGRSLKLSGAVFEELTENDDDDFEAFQTIKARLRRIVGIQENFLIAATNPEGPRHWAYKYFITSDSSNRKVFYSNTFDNPFLDPVYIEQLRQDLDPKTAERLIYGKWVEIEGDSLYHAYDSKVQYKSDTTYKVNPSYPIVWTHDQNIAEGKPMSSVFGQYINNEWHWFAEIIIHGSRTMSICEEAGERGLLDYPNEYVVMGDATGMHGSSKSLHSDYEIIQKFLSNFRGRGIRYKMKVARQNPPIKERHNAVNSYCRNDKGEVRMFVYKGCAKLDEGMRLTSLKKGGQYIEDDSRDYQHCTTAIGYAIVYEQRLFRTSILKATTSQR